MQLSLKPFLLLLLFFFTASVIYAQLSVTGTVYDSAKRNYVQDVRVQTTSGKFTMTDSMGRYNISVNEKDSLSFIYQNKSTLKFPVSQMKDLREFDISLHVQVKDGIKTLKEVVVFTKSYQETSAENRELYAKYFNFKKPALSTSISPGGAVGADVNEIINMFRFQRNKRLKAIQARLEQQEEDAYVKNRFNKRFVERVTQLKGTQLDSFMVRYTPTFEFARTADEVAFNRYVLNSSYLFKLELLKPEDPKLPASTKN